MLQINLGRLCPKKLCNRNSSQLSLSKPNYRRYAAPAQQGIKRKPKPRKLAEMPGRKKRASEHAEKLKKEAKTDGEFVRLFGGHSTPPPPEVIEKTRIDRSKLFDGEEEIPKETDVLIGGS